MLPGNPGQCIDLAVLTQTACGIIGVPASVGYVYATTDTDNFSTSWNAFEKREYEYAPGLKRDEFLRYFAAGDFNNWEAVCVVNGHYYAVKEAHNSDTTALLKELICPNAVTENYQCWRYMGATGWECNSSSEYPAPLPGGCP